MRQQMLINEDKDIRAKMADFEFSPEMQMAKLEGPEAENRVFTKKLNELRSIGRSDVDKPFPESRPAAPAAPRPAAGQPGMEAAAKTAFGSYDPTKYEYRISPETGKIQRKPK
jgi:hypothetical protein